MAVAVAVTATWSPGAGALAQDPEYTLETAATYDVRPDDRRIDVRVEMTFTNTLPDPPGQFSLFDELRVAIHDGATDVEATDADGSLEVAAAVEDEVNVATVELREGLRHTESVEIELTYALANGSDPQVRVGPSLVAFPAWGFGTSSLVEIAMPPGFEIRADGDPLTEAAGGRLTSGPIEHPGQWLALVTAVGPGEMATFETTVALQGGTADLVVRAFADDPEWGETTRDLAVAALPRIEEAIGLPYPLLGRLSIVQGVPGETGAFGDPTAPRSAIVVAFDEPPFTLLHQLAHVWLAPTLVESRWIVEGLASDVAARVGADLDVEPPFDPVAEAEARASAALPLAAWTSSSGADADRFGHAAAWALCAEIREAVGDDALGSVLLRTASSVGPYEPAELDGPPPSGSVPRTPLTSRSFLDQLEKVSKLDLSARFGEAVFDEADAALLPTRTAARDAFAALHEAADGWGVPDPVRTAMAAWTFDEAERLMADAGAWLVDRDALLADMAASGLAAPDRLQQAYRAYGGGQEAIDELAAQRSAVETYAATSARVGASRSFLARVGLIGVTDPSTQVARASGQFADGDLRGALASLDEADRMIASAESSGLVRLAALALLVVVLVIVAVALFRRRASYTAAR